MTADEFDPKLAQAALDALVKADPDFDVSQLVQDGDEPGDPVARLLAAIKNQMTDWAESDGERDELLAIDAKARELSPFVDRVRDELMVNAWRAGATAFTIAQFAAFLHMRPENVQRYIDAGRLQTEIIGGRTMVSALNMRITVEEDDRFRTSYANFEALTPEERVDRKLALRAYMASQRRG
jgi:hypothetical protein